MDDPERDEDGPLDTPEEVDEGPLWDGGGDFPKDVEWESGPGELPVVKIEAGVPLEWNNPPHWPPGPEDFNSFMLGLLKHFVLLKINYNYLDVRKPLKLL